MSIEVQSLALPQQSGGNLLAKGTLKLCNAVNAVIIIPQWLQNQYRRGECEVIKHIYPNEHHRSQRSLWRGLDIVVGRGEPCCPCLREG